VAPQTVFLPRALPRQVGVKDASEIVEAGETSGTLIQARGALEQGRRLFILESCLKRGLKWPERYLARGEVRGKGYEDVRARVKAKGRRGPTFPRPRRPRSQRMGRVDPGRTALLRRQASPR
jgi:predicted Rossmann fold nucleotide-binding protein DprA/Smf involved in DNA uptake